MSYIILIHWITLFIGMCGIGIIFSGIIRALFYFCFRHKECFPHARMILNSHLVLGLDFFVGKDVIDTILIHSTTVTLLDLVSLVTVVGIRITLNHFLLKELEDIKHEDTAYCARISISNGGKYTKDN